jgi:hypothetical protein
MSVTRRKNDLEALMQRLVTPVAHVGPSRAERAASRLRIELAVRGWCDPQALLPEELDGAERKAVLDAVAPEVEVAPRNSSLWWLRDEVRRRILTTRPAEEVRAALETPRAEGHGPDPVRAALLARTRPLGDLSALSAAELRPLAASLAWLVLPEGATQPGSGVDLWHQEVDAAGLRDTIGALIARLERQSDVKRMATARLYGREPLLRRLLDIVAAPLLPRTLGHWVYVSGLGGSGKSTLLAHLEAQLGCEPGSERGPRVVVHLDCDDPGFDAADMVALDLALLRQVGIVLPKEAPGLRRLARSLTELVRSGDPARPSPPATRRRSVTKAPRRIIRGAIMEEAVNDRLAARVSLMHGALRRALGDRQLVLLVDTVELVFARGQDTVAIFAGWAASLKRLMGAGDLRLIVAGRDPPEAPGPHALAEALFRQSDTLTVSDLSTLQAEPGFVRQEAVPLGDLSKTDAVAMLHDLGIPELDAAQLAHVLPRTPLLLRIAADLYAGKEERTDLMAAAGRSAIAPALAQRYLAERVVRHLAAPAARPYALPALALPYVTRSLVAEVVIPATDDRANLAAGLAAQVFAGMADAGWLVRRTGDGERLIFHAEVRRLAIELLEATPKDAGVLDAVRRRARKHFAGSRSSEALTLHAYFAALLDRSIPPRPPPGLDPAILGSAIEDLPTEVRTRLFGAEAAARTAAGGSFAVAENAREWRTRLEGASDWEGEGERLVKRARAADALALYRKRPTRPPGHPPTFVIQALADNAEWDTAEVNVAAVAEEIHARLGLLGQRVPNELRSRLYWLTRYELLARRGTLSAPHRALLHDLTTRITPRGPVLLFPAILAVAAAFARDAGLLPAAWLDATGAIESETRMFLVAHLYGGRAWEGRPHLDQLWVMQKDWPDRAAKALAATRFGEEWQATQFRLERAPLALPPAPEGPDVPWLNKIIRGLHVPVPVAVGPATAKPNAILLLRGMTPEVHRPLRAAVGRLAALHAYHAELAQIAVRAAARLGLPLREFSQDELPERLERDLPGVFTVLIPCADRARTLPQLCAEFARLQGNHTELRDMRRVAETALAWDGAICAGSNSEYPLQSHYTASSEQADVAEVRAESTPDRPLQSALTSRFQTSVETDVWRGWDTAIMARPFGREGSDGLLSPPPGFRHLFGLPAAAERFQVDGEDPRTSPAALATQRRRMRGLATLMGARPPDAPENPNLPSGYTYLAQLVAHDMVSTSMAFWSAGGPDPGVANVHRAPLRLRTLYGDGPGACPHAFAPDDARDQYRSRFRLSAYAGAKGEAADFRDIARAATPGTLGNRGGFAGAGRGEALIADSRNDQSALLSQLTCFFQMLHNALLDMIPKPGTLPARALRERTSGRFAVAREATTLVFRNVLRHDLLPRLLDPKVRSLYDNPAPEWLEPEPAPGVPLEFSHGAFRFSHAMQRDTYRVGRFNDAPLGDLLRLNSKRGPTAVPLTRDWLVRWSQFFQLPGQPAPNLSMKLGPRYTPMLMGDGLFDPIEPGDPPGVAFRDLMSASLTGMRSVRDLCARVAALRPGLAAQSPLLADPAARQAALAEWLGRDSAVSLLTAEDVAALAAEPPLPFYILFEAEHEAGGERLGTLGSLLVAETIYGALARERLFSEGEGGLGAALDRLCAAWLGEWRFPDPPLVEDMPGLVGYVARRLDLAAADPAFI